MNILLASSYTRHASDVRWRVSKTLLLALCGVFATLQPVGAKASGEDIGWNLSPGQCGRLNAGSDGMVIASHISAGSDISRPNVKIDVIEEINYKTQWQSTFSELHVGQEFVVGGQIYDVSSINVNPTDTAHLPRDGRMPGANCGGGDSYVSVSDVKKLTAGNEKNMILAAGPSAGLRLGEGPCVMAVSFGSMHDKQSVVSLEWHEESQEPWRTCDKWKSASATFGVNDVLDLHEYGRFRVKMIMPKTEKHTDWIVLVRD